MGIYLPTITSLIETNDVMKITPDTWHGVEHLLKKYWASDYSYQCTTRGYNHLSIFYDPIQNFKLPNIPIYNQEVGFVQHVQLNELLTLLKQYENLFLKNSKKIKEALLAHEKKIYGFFPKVRNERMLANQKKYHLERLHRIEQLDFYTIYTKAPLLKNISEFDLQDLFSLNYHPVIATAYWLKTQVFLAKKGIELNKSLLFTMLSSC